MTEENSEKEKDISQDQPQADVELDSGAKSLTDALRTSFTILKFIMVVLVFLFLVSGFFRVDEDENALVLTFGKVRGAGTEQRVLGPGFKIAWPEPIQEVVVVPVKEVQDVMIDSFWYFQTEEEKLGTRQPRIMPSLDPIQDGYCLTRNDSLTGNDGTDYNIVHAKWKLTYRIQDLEKFFSNIYYRAPKPGEDFLDIVAEDVEPLLKALADSAVVSTMVKYSIDQAIVSDDKIRRDVELLLQDKLDELECGIVVDAMQVVGRITWPRQVDNAFEAANKAQQQSLKRRTQARGYAEKLLTETGGPNAEYVLEGLTKADVTGEEKARLLKMLKGTCQTKIAGAYAYRTKVVKAAEANADYLKEILPQYRKRPKLFVQTIYQDAIEKIMKDAVEKIFIQPSPSDQPKEIRIQINRDPSISRRKKTDN